MVDGSFRRYPARRYAARLFALGNAKARTVGWNLPDPIPGHREPIYSPRVDLIAKYPTLPDAKQFRLPNIGFSVQRSAVDRGIARAYPLIVSSGRLVEYEG